jgi:hypothetical protein
MVEILTALVFVVPATILALAKYKRAQAEFEWAKRCDPMNPNFRPSLISRER